MAQSITLTSGSILNGNPITLAVKPNQLVGSTPSFHRVILEIECGIGDNHEVIKMSHPVFAELGEDVIIDISSALRTFRDSYEYTHIPTTYPIVKFNVKAYDEYMINGNVRTPVDEVWFPNNPAILPEEEKYKAYLCTVFGAFSDMERITAGSTKGVTTLSKKPTSSPEIVKVGETFVYAPAYTSEQKLEQSSVLTAPQSKEENITRQGKQTIGGHSLYALPENAPQQRVQMRFINSFGVLESVSVLASTEQQVNTTAEHFVRTLTETFGRMSRGTVRKNDNYETWKFSTGPLDEPWLRWYIHEFLMSEHIWLLVGETWLCIHIVPEETTTIRNSLSGDILEVTFSARFDINGSPIL